jgi:two-component system, chemotaxis family, CheB/CheR fusion protein
MVWIFLSAGLALAVILVAFGAALVIYQRRFLAMHRSYSDGLLQAQEQERAAVAREVHDDALQRVMILMHELDDWSGEHALPAAPTPQRFQGLRSELEDLSASLRQMAYRLHPSFVTEEGIVPMLERLAAEVDRSLASPPPLTSDQCLAVFRIAQEALSNVVRHAGKTRAIVRVTAEDHTLELTVEDYGAGFDLAGPRRRGLGLVSMAERARAIGGTLSVDSHPGGGTRVLLRLPVKNGEGS